MRVERFNRTSGQERAQRESHIGGVPHFNAGGLHQHGQTLPAEIRRSRQTIPSGLGPIAIGFFPARRRGDRALMELGASLIANPIKRRDPVIGEFASLFQHGLGHTAFQIWRKPIGDHRLKPSHMAERVQNIIDWRAITHDPSPLAPTLVDGGFASF